MEIDTMSVRQLRCADGARVRMVKPTRPAPQNAAAPGVPRGVLVR